ncbi:hypothetical protein ACFXBB_04805 [Streptomyces scopuliridis]|uniref:hypothetical protein n=1 Tax=Streptomyces scopuliridis TaxID=452529 RepID=UPI00368DB2BE
MEQEIDLSVRQSAALGEGQSAHPAGCTPVIALGREFHLDAHRQIRGKRVQARLRPSLAHPLKDVRRFDGVLSAVRHDRALAFDEQM